MKSLTKPPEQLVGAAYNLWRSLSGVKWLFDLRRLIPAQVEEKKEHEEIELKKVVELNETAKELDIDYDKELQRPDNPYQYYFFEFKRVNEGIVEF